MREQGDGRLGRVWTFMVLLAGGASAQRVNYPPEVCALKGSKVTLPCSFVPLTKQNATVEIIKVVWCPNHLICQGSTPYVYNSSSKDNDPRYVYLGDKTGNCTLQIMDAQKKDDATFRFRMESSTSVAHFTGKSGVKVTVVEKTELRVNSSSDAAEMPGGAKVTLRCTSSCSFHQLQVAWARDGKALPETGPALRLGPLTARDSGNYSCALDGGSFSQLYQLSVEGGSVAPAVGVVLGLLMALCIVFLVVFVARRKLMAANKEKLHAGAQVEPKPSSDAPCPQQDVNYATVHFTCRQEDRPWAETPDAVIYASVAVATEQRM